MLLPQHGKFWIINLKLINPNNREKSSKNSSDIIMNAYVWHAEINHLASFKLKKNKIERNGERATISQVGFWQNTSLLWDSNC